MVLSQRLLGGILTICGGVSIHLFLGTLYTFGNLNPYITSYMIYEGPKDTSLRYSKSMWIFALAVMGHGFMMTFGGMLHNRLGSRCTCLIGGTVLSLGVFFTYFAVQKSFVGVVFTYGLVFGIGIGISYSVPISCAMKWFPSRKGLISGIIVSGFGAGAFIFDQVQTSFINPDNLEANVTLHVGSKDERYFSQSELLHNVPNVFILLGCVYAAMNVVGSFLLREPQLDPAGQQASVYTSLMEDNSESEREESQQNNEVIGDKHPIDVIKTREFWTLWLMFIMNGQAVTFTSTLYKTYGETFISDDHFLAVVGSFAAIFNGFGRILWGYLADRTSFRLTMIIQCILMAVLFLTFTLSEKGGKWMYFLWVCLMFGTFCGNFALFPTATAKTFGQKYFTVNYGMVFTSQIISGAMAPLLAQTLSDRLGWFGMFSLVAGCSVAGLLLAFSYNAKKPNGKDI